MNKVKKFISVVLCIALLSGVGVQQVFAEGKISNVEQNEEVVLDDQNVKDNNEVTGENLEDVSKENSDIGDSEISQEDNEKQEQIEIRTDEKITSMDENGNITEVESVNGTLADQGIALLNGDSSAKIVNFNTKGSAVTEYTEYNTGYEGYTNGMYGADAAYLGYENGKVKFMLSGVIGLVSTDEVQVIDLNQASSISYYTVSSGRLFHKVTTNIAKNNYQTSLDNGPAPAYLQEGGLYYSYDGHYFYTRDSFGSMLDDYNNSNRKHSINETQPFYNYFQYLPFRSKTDYSSDQLNSILNNKINGRNSVMTNSAGLFLNYQNQYGVNAMLAIGVAANESTWGTSDIAVTKNNLFGLNAVDTSPGQSANTYESVDSCIKTFMETYMSKKYLNPGASLYAGGYLGNKASGINVKYASDPYWGEKNANIAWMIDKTYSNTEYAKYTLGVKDTIGTEHTNLNVRTQATTSSTKIHTTKKYSNQSFIILGKENDFYKVQSDAVLTDDRSSIASVGNYDYDKMYVYVSANYVEVVLEGKNGIGKNEEVKVPDSVKDAVEYEGCVQGSGWNDYVQNGQIAGTTGQNLALNAVKINIKNLEQVGIEYRSHVSNVGWQNVVTDGQTSGDESQSNWIEAIQVKLSGDKASDYDIYYRSHVAEMGWLDWAKNGELSGTQGYAYAVQAIQIVLVPKGSSAPGKTLVPFKTGTVNLQYQAYIQDTGWQEAVNNGEVAGITGKNLKIEALNVKSNTVKYRVYVQDAGWQEFKQNGEISGTIGKNQRLEALQIELTDENKDNYDIYYRVHVQDKGWLGWAKNGEAAGTVNYDLKIEAYQALMVPKDTPEISDGTSAFYQAPTIIQYSACVQDVGWQNEVKNGATAGTVGKNKKVQALKIRLRGQEYTGDIKYSVKAGGEDWQKDVISNEIAGTVGENKYLEAVKVELTGEMKEQYNIYYRVHLSDIGWLDWAVNGNLAGNEGYNKKIEAIQIQLVKKNGAAPGNTDNPYLVKVADIVYQAHVQDIGWQKEVENGTIAGTTGKNKQLEAVKIKLDNQSVSGSIQYRAHVQDIGWQDYVNADKIMGTVGKSKAIEAVSIKLTGTIAESYDVYYRVHAQDFGWLGWAKNGEDAGSQGYAKHVEAIQIQLVKKDGTAPGNTDNHFYKR